MKRVMIVDSLNQFIRSYIVDPSLSTNGQPIGGTKGFLKILQKLCRDINPDAVVICWDGRGGSRKRRSLVKEYKSGRKAIRLNRETDMTEDEELQNKIWQQSRLIEYLNELPVIQFMFDEVEADDVIGYVSKMPQFDGWQKVIVSSDKDFIQLCDGETVLFRPVQKEVLNKNNIIEKFGIHPNNFALARALVGDKSDNLEGVRGVGLPTVKKRFPFLSEEKSYTIQELIEFCDNVDSKLKTYKSILENEDLVALNYKLMQLYSPILSVQSKSKVDFTIDNFEFEFNKTEMIKMMHEDGFGSYNWDELFAKMKKISIDGLRGE